MEVCKLNKESQYLLVESKQNSPFTMVDKVVGFVLKIFGIILSIYLVVIGQTALNMYNTQNGTNQVTNKEFTYYTAKDFKNIQYFGKSKDFENVLENIKQIINATETKNDEELAKHLDVTDRSYLFYGPPGTGKTLFVKKLTYLLNEELTKKYGKKDEGHVRAYFITSSDLNSKWYGETERRIMTLFKEAREDKGFKATFIFLDEIDTFFNNRDLSGSEASNNHKTEFLNTLSGIKEDLRSNVFFMGATNRRDVLDEAFVRRLGHQIDFLLPKKKEVITLLKEFTKNWPGDNEAYNYDLIAGILVEREASQSLVFGICRRMINTYRKNDPNLRYNLIKLVKAANEKLNKIDLSFARQNRMQFTKTNILKFNIRDRKSVV